MMEKLANKSIIKMGVKMARARGRSEVAVFYGIMRTNLKSDLKWRDIAGSFHI